MQPINVTATFSYDDLEGEVDVRVTSLGCPAYISGPPEHCYPAEPPEFEIEGIRFDCLVWDHKTWDQVVRDRLETEDWFYEEVIRLAREGLDDAD